MKSRTLEDPTHRWASIIKRTGIYLLVIAVLGLVFAVCIPTDSRPVVSKPHGGMVDMSEELANPDIKGLRRKISGRQLIRPAQIQAAVRDNGAADKMLKKLTLRGVVQLGKDMVAYVQVGKMGVKSVRRGDKLLELIVKDVEPGMVTLSLKGVNVVLRN